MNYTFTCQVSYEAEVTVEAKSELEARLKIANLEVPWSKLEPVDPSEIFIEIEETPEEV